MEEQIPVDRIAVEDADVVSAGQEQLVPDLELEGRLVRGRSAGAGVPDESERRLDERVHDGAEGYAGGHGEAVLESDRIARGEDRTGACHFDVAGGNGVAGELIRVDGGAGHHQIVGRTGHSYGHSQPEAPDRGGVTEHIQDACTQ